MYYEDFSIGQEFRSPEKLVRARDIQEFANLTGDLNKIHLDEEHAASSSFKGIIAHGLLTLATALGLWYEMGVTNVSLVAMVRLDKVNFRAPVRPGDLISLRSRVISMRGLESKPDIGLVTWEDHIVNSRGEIVLDYERTFMLKTRHQA